VHTFICICACKKITINCFQFCRDGLPGRKVIWIPESAGCVAKTGKRD
jgi:hypothetical protein